MRNLFSLFKTLLPQQPLLVGTVAAAAAGGAWRIDLPGGGLVYARGQASLGQQVFVRDGLIEGQAPSLTYIEQEG